MTLRNLRYWFVRRGLMKSNMTDTGDTSFCEWLKGKEAPSCDEGVLNCPRCGEGVELRYDNFRDQKHPGDKTGIGIEKIVLGREGGQVLTTVTCYTCGLWDFSYAFNLNDGPYVRRRVLLLPDHFWRWEDSGRHLIRCPDCHSYNVAWKGEDSKTEWRTFYWTLTCRHCGKSDFYSHQYLVF